MTTSLQKPRASSRYRGVIASVPKGGPFGFISGQSCVQANGEPHDFPNHENIFIHQDDCAAPLSVGMMLSFEVIDDTTRGSHRLRAQAAIEVAESTIVPAHEHMIPGFGLTVENNGALSLAREAHPWHIRAKQMPAETVQKVVENQPMPTIPRSTRSTTFTAEQSAEFLRAVLYSIYPSLRGFGTDFGAASFDDTELDARVKSASEDLQSLNMNSACDAMLAEVASFRGIRSVLKMAHEDGLIRPDMLIPMRYLPDLFMAVPVWFYYTQASRQSDINHALAVEDPMVAESTHFFVNQFPNDRWADVFQMFNRRVRPLSLYQGDIIPPQIIRRIKTAIEAFDYVVIATPYHDVAGKDWGNLEWLRSIDPYVLGFKKGLPMFFVLGRFSDAGTFPLFNEMVADTVLFLETNKEKLIGFSKAGNPYWSIPSTHATSAFKLGDRLMARVDELLKAFADGNLFNWLRGE